MNNPTHLDAQFFEIVAAELEALSLGQITYETVGICLHVNERLRREYPGRLPSKTAGYDFMNEVFIDMGMADNLNEAAYPFVHLDRAQELGKWEGPAGEARRDFCRRAAIHLRQIAPC